MSIQTIGILSPGDMGQAIAAVLLQHQSWVIAALDGRIQRIRSLATEVGIQDVVSLENLVLEPDIIGKCGRLQTRLPGLDSLSEPFRERQTFINS